MPSDGHDMSVGGLYPMRVVTRLTGLTADTIRAWERRYRAVRPDRTAGNTRKYSAEDVRRLTLLRDSTQRGHAISSIASLSVPQLEALLEQEAPKGAEAMSATNHDGLVQRYLAAISRFEARQALEILTRAASLLDTRELVFKLLLPIMQEVGARYSHQELGIAEEHLVSEQLRGLLATLTRIFPAERNPTRILIATPAGHRHEFGALVAAALVAARGFEPLHLGPDLPDEDLAWAVRMSRCRVVVLSVVRDVSGVELERLSRMLEGLAERVDVWMGVPEGHALIAAAPSVRYFHRFEDFELALSQL